jgi:hypothetical protein
LELAFKKDIAFPAAIGWFWKGVHREQLNLCWSDEMAARRAIMRIQLDSVTKEELDELCDKRGMTQIAVMSRLVGWFVRQDDLVQAAVLSSLSEESLARLAKQLHKRLAMKGKGL